MKKFKIIMLTLGIAAVSVLVICKVASFFFDDDIAQFVVIMPALVIGMNARKMSEKVLGYTLQEAMKEESGV